MCAFFYSPRIVQSGLVLLLDVANSKSYSSGNTWYDLSGNGNHFDGTGHMPSVAYDNGIKYFNFTENPDTYLTESSLSNYNFGTAITLDIWIKNTGGDYRNVVSNGYSTGKGFEFRFSKDDYYGGVDNGTKLSFAFTNTDVTNGSISVDADLNVWRNFVGTYDGATASVYKDGVLFDTSTTTSGSIQQTVQDVYIGRLGNGSTGEDLTNPLSIVKIHNVTLTAQEVLQNYNQIKSRFGK